MAQVTVEDPIFREELEAKVGKLPSLVGPARAWAVDLAGHYASKINEVETFLTNNIRDHTDFKVSSRPNGFQKLKADLQRAQIAENSYSFLDEAFTDAKRAKLLAHFAASVHLYAKNYIDARGLTPTSTAQQVGDWLAGNTMAAHAINTATEYFKVNLRRACMRVRDDWDDLETLFFEGQAQPEESLTMLKLSEITIKGSDYHKRGKSVFILEFKLVTDEKKPTAVTLVKPRKKLFGLFARKGKATTNTVDVYRYVRRKLVYKPTDIENDCRLVGDTRVLTQRLGQGAALPDLSQGSLFEVINELEPGLNLPIYRILPRNPVSRMGNQMPLPIYDSYGYIEYLTFLPEREAPIDTNEAEQWDWIATDLNEVRDWYIKIGWYMVIGRLFGLCDIHHENLRTHKRMPYLIDQEVAFRSRTTSVQSTGLTGGVLSSGNTDTNEAAVRYYKEGEAIPTLNESATDRILHGASKAIDFFRKQNVRQRLTQWLQDVHLGNTAVRLVPVPTERWSEMLYCKVYGRDNCLAAAPQGARPAEGHLYDEGFFYINPQNGTQLKEPWTTFFGDALTGWYSGRSLWPLFPLTSTKHDWQCFLHCDVPAYYRRLNSLDLLDARGRVVPVGGANLPNQRSMVQLKQDFGCQSNPARDITKGAQFYAYDTLNKTGNSETAIQMVLNQLKELNDDVGHIPQANRDKAFRENQIIPDIRGQFNGPALEGQIGVSTVVYGMPVLPDP